MRKYWENIIIIIVIFIINVIITIIISHCFMGWYNVELQIMWMLYKKSDICKHLCNIDPQNSMTTLKN